MDEKSQQKLNEIVKKEFAALTEGDKVFLRARRSYLTDDQLKTFADVFQAKAKKKDE